LKCCKKKKGKKKRFFQAFQKFPKYELK
jgi:hypothetical protein